MISLLKNIVRYFMIKIKFPNSFVDFMATVSLDSHLEEGVKIQRGTKIGGTKICSYSYLGSNCRIERTYIGSFTSIGPEVVCGLAAHPINFVSTYPGFYTNQASGAVWFGSYFEFQDMKNVNIGSDVWIGTRAIILGGVTIGHGAVIGSGAVVTKDIPPYAIAVGIPAKVIKYRFDEDLRYALLESEWWKFDKSTIKEVACYMNDPVLFLEYIKHMNLVNIAD